MNLDDVLQTFLQECEEQLAEMERCVLAIEQGERDPELLNALFRSVHTIKGSAGLFGLDSVVSFAHVVETVLDRLRGGEIEATRRLTAVLLKSRDHIALLVELREGASGDDDVNEVSRSLSSELECFSPPRKELAASESEPEVEASGGGPVDNDTWHVSLRLNVDVFRNGLDPIGMIRYLGTLGELCYVATVVDALPEPDAFDPESCYLGFEIDLRADVRKSDIEAAFEFVREDCELRILPPGSRVSDYLALIQELPEDETRLGEMLVASGALTFSELHEALRLQEQRATSPQTPTPIGEMLVGRGVVQPELVEAALNKQRQVREGRGAAKQLRVRADKLDHLINLVGELVIASAAASVTANRSGDPDTQEAVSVLSMLVEEIRDNSLQLRMVPIGETFQRFQRVVRDVSEELAKDIELRISGAETELDKTVVEQIADPLTHLVRNAVDHGIEAAELRQERGKNRRGTVTLNAYHDSGSMVIEVKDDGGGLDRDRIVRKAVENGLVNDAATLSDYEIYQLIFEPGFSTASAVTNLSGRGVGMDVVRRNIEALRGTVDVDTSPGNGTTFRIRLPLTLAIIDGFLMKVGEAAYVVPLEAVVECVEFTSDHRQEASHRDVINLRGEALPLIRLRDFFGLPECRLRRENIVVVRYAGRQAGLVVDALMGEHQTVIKPLGPLFGHLAGVSGSTILGDGRVALILDVPALIQSAADTDDRRQKGARSLSHHAATTVSRN